MLICNLTYPSRPMAVTPVAAQSLGKQACLSPAAAIHLNLGHSSSQPTQLLPKFATPQGCGRCGSAALPASVIEVSHVFHDAYISALPRHTLGCATTTLLKLCRFHIHFFGWFSALCVPVYLLTSIARYDIPRREASCRAPVSPPNLPAFVPG